MILYQSLKWSVRKHISSHDFVDGNKRIGIYVMSAFLEVNGIHKNLLLNSPEVFLDFYMQKAAKMIQRS